MISWIGGKNPEGRFNDPSIYAQISSELAKRWTVLSGTPSRKSISVTPSLNTSFRNGSLIIGIGNKCIGDYLYWAWYEAKALAGDPPGASYSFNPNATFTNSDFTPYTGKGSVSDTTVEPVSSSKSNPANWRAWVYRIRDIIDGLSYVKATVGASTKTVYNTNIRVEAWPDSADDVREPSGNTQTPGYDSYLPNDSNESASFLLGGYLTLDGQYFTYVSNPCKYSRYDFNAFYGHILHSISANNVRGIDTDVVTRGPNGEDNEYNLEYDGETYWTNDYYCFPRGDFGTLYNKLVLLSSGVGATLYANPVRDYSSGTVLVSDEINVVEGEQYTSQQINNIDITSYVGSSVPQYLYFNRFVKHERPASLKWGVFYIDQDVYTPGHLWGGSEDRICSCIRQKSYTNITITLKLELA